MSAKGGRLFFLINGCIFTVFTIIYFTASILGGVFFAGYELSVAATAVMGFCLAYLHPHSLKNKEQAKQVRGQGSFCTCIFILGYLCIFMLLYQFEVISFTGFQAVSLLAFLTISTLYLSFVFITHKNNKTHSDHIY